MNFIELVIFIALASSAIGYIVSDTKAFESYSKLFCRMARKGSAFFNDPIQSRLNFWTRLGIKWPNSFWIALASCGECLSVFCSIAISVIFGDGRLVIVFATVWVTVVFYYSLVKIVYILNRKG